MQRRRTTSLLALTLTLSLSLVGCSDEESPRTTAPTAAATPSPASSPTPAQSPSPRALDTSSAEVIVSGLEAPWGIDFLPGGDALVTERDTARVLRVPAGGGRPTEVLQVEAAVPRGEGGLLGLAVSPTWDVDGAVYLYVTTAEDNRIVRFSTDRPGEQPEPVLTGIPRSSVHNGGRIEFGPDGHLYSGTGDAGNTSLSQDPASLGGKVLRMDLQGRPVDGADSVVFSRGHRNVQGIAFDGDGRVYAVEFGQNRFDEVNLVEQGTNGGWPEVEGPGDGGGRFLAPIVTWDTSEASPSGAAIVGDTLYVAALRGERLWQVPLDGNGGVGEPRSLFEGEYGRLRTAKQAPDGSLWVLTSNRDGRGDPVAADDRILRLGVR